MHTSYCSGYGTESRQEATSSTLPRVLIDLILTYQEPKITLEQWARRAPVKAQTQVPTEGQQLTPDSIAFVWPAYRPRERYGSHVTVMVGEGRDYAVKKVRHRKTQ